MVKWVIFEDSVNDQHAYPVSNINALFVTSATNITVYARNPLQPTESVSDDTIALTCTSGSVDETLDVILNKLASDNINVTTINTVEISSVTTVAYTAGA
tara:strand:- start:1112 stop:1411 length:300 start_codon:yes stop_codon:yes gene_type:complete